MQEVMQKVPEKENEELRKMIVIASQLSPESFQVLSSCATMMHASEQLQRQNKEQLVQQ